MSHSIVHTRQPFLTLAAAMAITLACKAQCTFTWDSRFGVEGLDGPVHRATTFDDGTGPALYVGGSFAVAETQAGGNVAKRAGSHWISPGGGLPSSQITFGQNNPPVACFATWDDGGGPRLFAARGAVYRLGPSSWTPLTSAASGINPGGATDLAAHDDGSGSKLYACGFFSRPGGTFAGVARWDGANWLQVGGDFTTAPPNGPQMHALARYTEPGGQTNLYAGGVFDHVGGFFMLSVARWNGSTWNYVGPGLSNGTLAARVDDLHVWNDGTGDHLYACGSMTNAGATPTFGLARWNGFVWSSIGDLQGSFFTLGSATVGGVSTLFVGGAPLQSAGGVAVSNIAAYAGAWSNPGGGITSSPSTAASQVWMLHEFDDGTGPKLCVGGRFNRPGGQANGEHITTWNGTAWARIDSPGPLLGGEFFEVAPLSSFSPTIEAAVVHDDGSGPALFVCGEFNRIGGVNANRIAKFDGQNWSALGTGLNGYATSLAVFDDGGGPKLFVGGNFSSANGVLAARLAKWNGTNFSSVPGWVGSQLVYCLTVYDDGTGPALWVGQNSPNGQSPPGQSIALRKWTPGGFVNFPRAITMTQSPVIPFSMAVQDWGIGPRLVVGGIFNNVGGVPSSGVFAWDGTNVDTMAGGFGSLNGTFPWVAASTVYSAPLQPPRLVVGGTFGTAIATGQPTLCIAQWDGVQWLPLGTGVNMTGDPPEVKALRPFRDGLFESLYVGGRFIDAGGVGVSHLARWDGASWSDVGAGGVRFVGKALRAWVSDLIQADLGNGAALVATGAFNTAGPAVGSGLIAAWTPARPSITLSQPFAGGPVSVLESGLVTGQEYFSLFSFDLCGAGPGTGPYAGLCASNIVPLVDQVSLPVGTVPFHFIAGGPTAQFGPFPGIPPLTVDAVVIERTSPSSGCPSVVTRFSVQ
jgi:trimeric autotransporter adhesin